MTFILFEMFFRIFLLFLLMEGGRRFIDILLHFQRYSYVTQNNYQHFLANPVTLIGLLFALLVLLLLVLYESCGLFLLFDAGRCGVQVSLSELMVLSFHQTLDFIKRYPLKWILYMLLCVPNLYLHLLVWEVDRTRFVEIVAGDICELIGIPAFVLILVTCLLFAMFFSLAVPFRVFGKEEPFGKNMISYEVGKGNQTKHILSGIFLHLRVFLAAGACFAALVALCVEYIRIFKASNRYVSDAMVYGSNLKLLFGILVGILGTVTILGYIHSVYAETQEFCIDWTVKRQARNSKMLLASVCLITFFILSFESRHFIPNTAEAQDYLEISAHRGGAKFAPENTMAAIQFAIDCKADYAEIDVQETADGVLVLSHDSYLGRTANVKKFIWEVTYAETQEMEVGSHFNPVFEGEKIPTLQEVIEACRGKIRLNIEIKSNKHNQDIVEKVVDLIRQEQYETNCIVTSMDYKFLKQIKELYPEVVTGYTLNMEYGEIEKLEAVDVYSIKYTYLTRELVDRIHTMGRQVYAWTANSRRAIRWAIDTGVDNIITDNPDLVRKELLREYDAVPSFVSLFKYAIQ